MNFNVIILIAVAAFSTNVLAKTVTFNTPEVTVPSATLQGEPLKLIANEILCFRDASFFEKFNNGLDEKQSCDKVETAITPNVGRKFVIESNQDGSFDLPSNSIKVTNKKKEKTMVLCLNVEAIVEIKDLGFGGKIDLFARSQGKAFKICNKINTPSEHRIKLEDFEKAMSKALEF